MAARYRFKGADDSEEPCSCCGIGPPVKKVTAWLAPLDEDGNEEGDPLPFGRQCAAMKLRPALRSKPTPERAHKILMEEGQAEAKRAQAEWHARMAKVCRVVDSRYVLPEDEAAVHRGEMTMAAAQARRETRYPKPGAPAPRKENPRATLAPAVMFHTTTANAAASIRAHGFRAGPRGDMGQGVYLSRAPVTPTWIPRGTETVTLRARVPSESFLYARSDWPLDGYRVLYGWDEGIARYEAERSARAALNHDQSAVWTEILQPAMRARGFKGVIDQGRDGNAVVFDAADVVLIGSSRPSKRRANPVDRAVRWYHGTTEASARAALERGRLWGKAEAGRGRMDPLEGRVYMTRDLATALTYGFGAMMAGHDPFPGERFRGRGAVLEVVPGPGCVPDEDWVGLAIGEVLESRLGDKNPLHPELYPAGSVLLREVPSALSDRWERYARYKLGEAAVQSSMGKAAIRALQKTARGRAVLDSLTTQAPLVACDETSRVVRGWSFDKQDSKRFDPSGANFFDLATPLEPALRQANPRSPKQEQLASIELTCVLLPDRPDRTERERAQETREEWKRAEQIVVPLGGRVDTQESRDFKEACMYGDAYVRVPLTHLEKALDRLDESEIRYDNVDVPEPTPKALWKRLKRRFPSGGGVMVNETGRFENPAWTEQTAVDELRRRFGEPEYTDATSYFKPGQAPARAVRLFTRRPVPGSRYFSGFIWIDESVDPKRLAARVRKALLSRRQLSSSVVSLHDWPIWIATPLGLYESPSLVVRRENPIAFRDTHRHIWSCPDGPGHIVGWLRARYESVDAEDVFRAAGGWRHVNEALYAHGQWDTKDGLVGDWAIDWFKVPQPDAPAAPPLYVVVAGGFENVFAPSGVDVDDLVRWADEAEESDEDA